jgi:hypothetical protein
MSDRLPRLQTLLAELTDELRATTSLDEPTRQQLAEAASAMIAALQRDEPHPPQDREDSGTLRDRIVEFEASHPNLAAVMNRLIDMLGQMGI